MNFRLPTETAPWRSGSIIAILCLFVVTPWGGFETAQAQGNTINLPIREHVFDNGLRLLVLHRPDDHRVACKIFTDMGAINEIPGEAGAAHFLEHLMFKGTHSLGTKDWEAERPLFDELMRADRELIDALNNSSNTIRQRGVFHDYRHADTSQEIQRVQERISELSGKLADFRDGGAMMRWYQAYGGSRLTATTEQEYMKFDINLPVERVDLFLRVEADRMAHSVFREFDEERMILVEQRLGDLNRPTTPYYEQVTAASGVTHPVFWPEGHYPMDFVTYTRTFEKELYDRYFVVNNTTLVFVGGVTLEQMIPRVERFFGFMEPAQPPMRSKSVEPLPSSERRVTYRSNQITPRIEFRHMIPAIGHPDRPHFDPLAEVAAMEIKALLAEKQIAGTVNVNTRVVHTSRFGVPSTLNFEIIVPDVSHLDKAEEVLLAAIERLSSGTTTEGRLRVAKKRLRVAWYRLAMNPDALAFEIGHFQTMDSWQTLPTHLEKRELTSLKKVEELAQRYLIPDNRTVGVARPKRPDNSSGPKQKEGDR